MLCRALADTGVAGYPDEYLLAADPHQFPHWGYWESGLFGRAWGARDRQHYLEQVMKAGSSPNGVFGLKLMWNQVPWVVGLFRELPMYRAMEPAEIFTTAFPNLHVVLLTRKDRVRQAVSWARAAHDGGWKVRADLPANPTGTPVFDADLIRPLQR